MSQQQMILVMLAVLVPLWLRLQRDYAGGLAYAVFVLLTFTPLIRIQTPGNLPELTIHRLVLFTLVVAWFKQPHHSHSRDVPVLGWMTAWAAATFLSFLHSDDHALGLKRYLDYILELFVFYFILATTLRKRDEGLRVLRAAVTALSIVAVMAVIERYSGINLVDRFVSMDPEASPIRDVRVTYRHRILLGTAMAMAFPLAVAMTQIAISRTWRLLAWVAAIAMVAGCYFTMSRGPWLALGLAVALLAVFGTLKIRKPLMILGLSVIFILVARPGVYDTLSNRAAETANIDSFKGGTFQYRLELWLVAYDSIRESPSRLLVGFGPGAGANQTVGWSLSYRDRDTEIWSWDNTLAYALFQYGFVGLAMTLGLYGAIVCRLLALARSRSGQERDILLCLCASSLVLFFMMTNVLIFARQLYYLLWIVTAVGLIAIRQTTAKDAGIVLAEGEGLPPCDATPASLKYSP
jgi:O-antigen ligase